MPVCYVFFNIVELKNTGYYVVDPVSRPDYGDYVVLESNIKDLISVAYKSQEMLEEVLIKRGAQRFKLNSDAVTFFNIVTDIKAVLRAIAEQSFIFETYGRDDAFMLGVEYSVFSKYLKKSKEILAILENNYTHA